MAIKVRDIKKFLKLLERSRDALSDIYGDRVKKAIPLYNDLNEAIKDANS